MKRRLDPHIEIFETETSVRYWQNADGSYTAWSVSTPPFCIKAKNQKKLRQRVRAIMMTYRNICFDEKDRPYVSDAAGCRRRLT